MVEFENAKGLAHAWHRVFLYGSTGSSKTLQASFFPEPLFLFPATEKSIDTVAGRDLLFKSIRTTDEMETTVLELLKLQTQKGSDALPAQTIVFESVSHYVDMVVDEITGNGKKPMEMRDWGKLRSHMLGLTNNLLRLDAHIVFTSLADDPNPESGKPGAPKIQGSTRDLMPSVCRTIAYMEARAVMGKPTAFIAHLTNYRGYYARDRRPGIPSEVVVGPTQETSLFNHIFAGR
jgi:hypothetical protein